MAQTPLETSLQKLALKSKGNNKAKEKVDASHPLAFQEVTIGGQTYLVSPAVPAKAKPTKPKKKDKEKDKNVGSAASLRCPGPRCSGYVYAPAMKCGAGHVLCVTCAAWHTGHCPICKKTNVTSPVLRRTIAFELEKQAETLLVSCNFRSRGCHFRFPREEIVKHQVECCFAQKQCFSTKCDFLGDNQELATHMEKVHAERVIEDTETEFIIKKIISRTSGVVHVQYLRNNYGDFWIKYMYSGTEMQLYGAVQYIGPRQEAEKLQYQFEMKEYDENKFTGLKAIYTGKIYTHVKTFETIFESQDCFTVTLDFAQYFENNDVLHLTVRIIPAEEA